MDDRVCYSVNHEGIVTWISPNVFDMFGWEAHEVIGRNFVDFVPSEDMNEVVKNRTNRVPGITQEYKMGILRKDGKREMVYCRVLQTPENTIGSLDRRLTSRPIIRKE